MKTISFKAVLLVMVVSFICPILAYAQDLKPIKLVELQKEGTKSKVIATSYITITREEGPTRKAMIKGFSEPIFFGVHGGKQHAATLDHIIAGVGG